MNDNVRKKYLAMRKKEYIMAHPTILRDFIWECGIYGLKCQNIPINFMTASFANEIEELGITLNYIRKHPNHGWVWMMIYHNEASITQFINKNEHNLSLRKWPYNKFAWNNTIYERELSRDIADRRGRIKELSDMMWPIAHAICRYIDYV